MEQRHSERASRPGWWHNCLNSQSLTSEAETIKTPPHIGPGVQNWQVRFAIEQQGNFKSKTSDSQIFSDAEIQWYSCLFICGDVPIPFSSTPKKPHDWRLLMACAFPLGEAVDGLVCKPLHLCFGLEDVRPSAPKIVFAHENSVVSIHIPYILPSAKLPRKHAFREPSASFRAAGAVQILN